MKGKGCGGGGGGGGEVGYADGHIFRNGQYKTRTVGCGLGIKCGLRTM